MKPEIDTQSTRSKCHHEKPGSFIGYHSMLNLSWMRFGLEQPGFLLRRRSFVWTNASSYGKILVHLTVFSMCDG